MFVGHVDAGGVGALGAVQVTRQRDARVRQAEAAFQVAICSMLATGSATSS
jgi:hypothetical protein